MLVQFSVGNFRSFKDVVTLDLTATNLVSKNKAVDENNTFEAPGGLRLLKSVVLYGANASGKSNLLKALEFMKIFVNDSAKESQVGDPINAEPFLLDSKTEKEPSFFEIVFFLNNVRYRYGFEVTTKEVVSEWLYHMPNKKEIYLFTRDKQEITVSRNFKEGRGIEDRTRENALFLSIVGLFNGKMASSLITWFSLLGVFSWRVEDLHRISSIQSLKDEILREAIINIIKQLDLAIDDVRLKTQKASREEINSLMKKSKDHSLFFGGISRDGEEIELTDVYTVHKKYNNSEDSQEVLLKLSDHESDGTQKLFALTSAITKNLMLQNVLIIDEIDAKFHPLVTEKLIELYHIKQNLVTEKLIELSYMWQNFGMAQLIFPTHDVNLLSNDRFRRDQIWFVEKDKFGASHLYSLSDFKVRNDASYQKDYLQGRYGAIPFIGAQNFMEGWSDAKETRKAS
jgi:uncharacterized protein